MVGAYLSFYGNNFQYISILFLHTSFKNRDCFFYNDKFNTSPNFFIWALFAGVKKLLLEVLWPLEAFNNLKIKILLH